MTIDEFYHTYNCRKSTGPCACTGEEPCIHAMRGAGGWFCRNPKVISPANAFACPIPSPDNTVCNQFCAFPPGPSVKGVGELAQQFKATNA